MATISKDEEIIKRGLIANPSIINPSDKLIETLKLYETLPIAHKNYEVHTMTIEDALFDAQKFLMYYYKLHKVPSVSIHKLLGHQIHIGRTVNPLKLPVNLVPSDDIFSGSVTEIITNRNPHIIFSGINLNGQTTEQTSSSYVHEITHTQLDRLKGSIQEYYNMEVLSIFNELFHASILDNDERILRLNDSRRIYEMSITAQELRDYHAGKSPMSRDELLDCCKYLISDLKAYQLFAIFYSASDTLKNEILDDIQSIFDGFMTVEELLNKYEVSLESVENSPQILKYCKR